jgi:RNA polymerase sigma factor (sigma-70 family)
VDDARARAFADLVEARDQGLEAPAYIAARNLVVDLNMGLVWREAHRRQRGGLDIQDLAQVGVIGVMRACETWDPAKGAFTTHAVPWIRHAILRFRDTHASTVRAPVHARDTLSRLARLSQHSGASDEELAQALGVDGQRLSALRCIGSGASSLDRTIGDGDGATTFLDQTAGRGEDPVRALDMFDLDSELDRLLSLLPPAFEEVLRARLGPDAVGVREHIEATGRRYSGGTRKTLQQQLTQGLEQFWQRARYNHPPERAALLLARLLGAVAANHQAREALPGWMTEALRPHREAIAAFFASEADNQIAAVDVEFSDLSGRLRAALAKPGLAPVSRRPDSAHEHGSDKPWQPLAPKAPTEGSFKAGSANRSAKLDDAQLQNVGFCYVLGAHASDIALWFGIGRSLAWRIGTGRPRGGVRSGPKLSGDSASQVALSGQSVSR